VIDTETEYAFEQELLLAIRLALGLKLEEKFTLDCVETSPRVWTLILRAGNGCELVLNTRYGKRYYCIREYLDYLAEEEE
jgi:hypothetical protein